MVAISEVRSGMGIFSSAGSPIGTVQSIDREHIVMLGGDDGAFSGHYRLARVLIAGIDGDRVHLSPNAEAALILEEAYETGPEPVGRRPAAPRRGSRPGAAVIAASALLGAIAGGALAFLLAGRSDSPATNSHRRRRSRDVYPGTDASIASRSGR